MEKEIRDNAEVKDHFLASTPPIVSLFLWRGARKWALRAVLDR